MPTRIIRVFHFPTNYVIAKPRICPTCTGSYLYKSEGSSLLSLHSRSLNQHSFKATTSYFAIHRFCPSLKSTKSQIPILYCQPIMSDQNSSSLQGYVDSAIGGVQSAVGSLTGNTDHQVRTGLSSSAMLLFMTLFLPAITLVLKAWSPPPCPTQPHPMTQPAVLCNTNPSPETSTCAAASSYVHN